MSKIAFPQFLKDKGIKLLFASHEKILPGVIIGKRRKGFLSLGTLEQILGAGEGKWASELLEANFVQGNVERTLSLNGKSSLSELGVGVSGGLNRVSNVSFEITDVKARVFKSQSRITITPDLIKVRDKDKATWKLINNKWLADTVYYAAEMKVTFKTDTDINLKANIEKQIKVSPGAEVKWTSNRSFLITKNQEVPFGFSGWKI